MVFPLRSALLALLTAASFVAILPQPGLAADPSPTPAAASPIPAPSADQVEELAKALVAAPDDAERRRLLAAAPPALANDERVRRRFHYLTGARIYAGEYDRARALHAFSRVWCAEHDDKVGLALEDWGEANIDGFQGRNREALERFERVGRFFAETGDAKREATVLIGASVVRLHLGDYHRALAGAERALAVIRPTGDRELITNSLQLLGNIYNEEGQPERAIGCFEQALAESANDEEWQTYLLHNLGNSLAARGDLPGAIALTERSLALARKRQDRPRTALVLTTLAGYETETGRLGLAEAHYREALADGEDLGEIQRQTLALIGLGNVVARRPQRPESSAREALAYANRAIELARQTANPTNLWQARTLAGRLLRQAGRAAEARAELEEAIALIENARGRLTGGDAAAETFFENKISPYHEMVALLAGENRAGEALEFAERAKARVLLEILRGPKAGVDEFLTSAERETLAKHAEEIARLNKAVAASPAAERASLESQLARARVTREAAEDDALAAHPDLRRRVPPTEADAAARLTPAALRALLSTDKDLAGAERRATALLEFVVAEDESWAFVVRRDSVQANEEPEEPEVRAVRLPLGRAALATRTETFRRTLAERGLNWSREARALGEDVLGPIRPLLGGVERLIIVPDGPLWELPFQTLPWLKGEGTLRARDTLAARRFSLTPSLGFLIQARVTADTSSPPADQGRLLAFGNPSVDHQAPNSSRQAARAAAPSRSMDFAPLPEAEREVRALEKIYGADRSLVLVGDRASEEAYRRKAGGDYDVIHFATHGVCNDRAPLYSHLLLAQTDLASDEDGFLEAWEIMRQPLRAHLAVLSACETARGRVGAGEGMLGLSWAFFSAGCPSCVVSQWKVDSASNTDLMVKFYRELHSGASRAEALRRASLALAERTEYRHPFYWAPFVLVGDGD